MNQLNNDANEFRSKVYEPLFKGIIESYNNNNQKEFVINGGSTSGKSIVVSNNICFWLPEMRKDKALIVTYSTLHKTNTKKLLNTILEKQGYSYTNVNEITGDVIIKFGNENEIVIRSAKTSSIAELEEKFKTGDSMSDSKFKFVWFEEFTAVLNTFGGIKVYSSVASRIARLCKEDVVFVYTYNPPNNRNHLVYEFMNGFKGEVITTTIYDLPVKWQDKNTLKRAEILKESNYKAYQHIYLGIPTLTDGLAFDLSYDVFKQEINQGDYMKFVIQTDEATTNATTFGLFGLTYNGELHRIRTYYHSSKEDGLKKALSTYAQEFTHWYNELGVEASSITTDGLAFAEELKKLGYNAKAITSGVDDSKKDRVLSYQILNDLVLTKKYKIINHESNMIVYEQIKNAELEYSKDDKPMVSKKKESTDDNTKHFHAGDCELYTCLVLQKVLIRGSL